MFKGFSKKLKAAAKTYRYKHDPVAYYEEVLGLQLWSGEELVQCYGLTAETLRHTYQHTADGTEDGDVLPVIGQREVVGAIGKHHRIGISSGFTLGKTTLASGLPAWWLRTRIPSMVITIAPTYRQLSNQLWGEIRLRYIQAEERGYPLGGEIFPKNCEWDIDFERRWYAIGFSTDQVDRIQGFHHPHLMLICDEAFSLPYDFMRRIEDLEPEVWISIGNPTNINSYLGEAFRDPAIGQDWWLGVMSQEISPNVLARNLASKQGIAVQELAKRLAPKFPHIFQTGLEDPNRAWPGICGGEHPGKQLTRAMGDRDDGSYRVGQRGQFPSADDDSLISWWAIQKSIDRYKTEIIKKGHRGIPSFGLDLAWSESGDYNILYARFEDSNSAERIFKRQGKDHKRLVLKILEAMKELGYAGLCFDVYGVGAAFESTVLDILDDPHTTDEDTIILESFHAARWGNRTRDADPIDEKRQFYNRKAELYFQAARWIRAGGAIGGSDLAKQMAAMKVVARSDGLLIMEDKKSFKKRVGISPDDADAFVLTFEEATLNPNVY